MSLFRRNRTGIVNVRMVITEEKILSNIDKVQRMINPKSKKQIVELEEDSYFKDLIESIKTYLIEYPKKKNFPSSVYNAAYGLVEFATNQFEENTKQIESLIRQRENNINLGTELKEVLEAVQNKEKNWKDTVKESKEKFGEDMVEPLMIIGRARTNKSQNYQDALKLVNARIANLESNLHIEIDMERIEDRSKALSYIGIEVADALKLIPAPQEDEIEEIKEENIENIEEEPVINEPQNVVEPEPQQQYFEQTRVEVKPSLWQRFKNSKFVKAISYIMKIKVVIQTPEALPEGRGENR